MKLRASTVAATICLISLAVGCNFLTARPSTVVNKYWAEGVKSGNTHMEDFFSRSRRSELGVDKLRDKTLLFQILFMEVKSINIVREEATGDTAEVDVKLVGDKEEFSTPLRFTLVKETDRWRIDHIDYVIGHVDNRTGRIL